ncbi:hypothetical protein BK819_10540 [Microbacterium sp. LCT-H2]|nr:hypothetical protein [Microbacterium sp. LCT-H2]OIJ32970.1 hypothetical protein BK819_10540 [Microbacterium sp. LCT-H2]
MQEPAAGRRGDVRDEAPPPVEPPSVLSGQQRARLRRIVQHLRHHRLQSRKAGRRVDAMQTCEEGSDDARGLIVIVHRLEAALGIEALQEHRSAIRGAREEADDPSPVPPRQPEYCRIDLRPPAAAASPRR